jgi:hypothetical protein
MLCARAPIATWTLSSQHLRADTLSIWTCLFFFAHETAWRTIARYPVPTIFSTRKLVAAGGLVSYNRKTATALGLAVPIAQSGRADEVIE